MTTLNPGRVRASDAEREQVVSVLREAMSEGRLTLDEGEERIAATYAVTYRDELPAFTADLPPVEQPPPGPPRFRTGRPGHQQRPGHEQRSRRPRPSGPPAGLVALLAVAAGIWALAAGGPLWPAIVLGVLTLMLAKAGGACHPQHHRRHRDREEPAAQA